jgi:sensor histidine kinase YesM
MADDFIEKSLKQQAFLKNLVLFCIPIFTFGLCFLIFYSPGLPDIPSVIKGSVVTLILIYLLKLYAAPLAIKNKNTAIFLSVLVMSTIFTTLVYYFILETGLIQYPSYIDRSIVPMNLIIGILVCVSFIEFFTACSFYLLYKTCQLSIKTYTNIINGYKNEIKALRQQYNPYFLYNSLSSLNLIIEEENYDKALDYNAKIASLLNMQMQHLNTDHISLEEEIIWLKNYLHIEQVRTGNKLQHIVEIDDEDLYLQHIPPMLLQPIVQSIVIQQSTQNIEEQSIFIFILIKEKAPNEIVISIKIEGINRDKHFIKPITLLNTDKKISLINQLNKFKIDFKQDDSMSSTYYELIIKENADMQALNTNKYV